MIGIIYLPLGDSSIDTGTMKKSRIEAKNQSGVFISLRSILMPRYRYVSNSKSISNSFDPLLAHSLRRNPSPSCARNSSEGLQGMWFLAIALRTDLM